MSGVGRVLHNDVLAQLLPVCHERAHGQRCCTWVNTFCIAEAGQSDVTVSLA